MSYDPWNYKRPSTGASEFSIQKQRELKQKLQAPINLDQLLTQSRTMSLASEMLGETSVLAPELLAETASRTNIDGVLDQYSGMDSALRAEVVNSQYDDLLKGRSWQEQQNIWDTLPASLRGLLQAEGKSRPEDPSPGGINIPWTSGVKRILDLVPGDQFGPGNLELFGGTDTVFTQRLQSILGVLDAPIDSVIKPAFSGAIEGMTAIERYTTRRPLAFGQLAMEGDIEDGGLWGQFTDTLGQATKAVPGGILGADLLYGVKALFDGRASELWAITSDARQTYRPRALEKTAELLDGDLVLQGLAIEFHRNKGDLTKTAESFSGAEVGSQEFMDTLTLLSAQFAPEGEELTPFQEALQALSRDRVGMGYQLAEQTGLDQDDPYFDVASAMQGLAFSLVFDPTILAGKANRLRRIAAAGLRAGDLTNEVRRMRWLARGARAVDGNIDDLPAEVRALMQPPTPRMEDLIERAPGGLTLQQAYVLKANQHVTSGLRDHPLTKLVLSEESQLRHGEAVQKVIDRIAWASRGADDAGEVYQWSDLFRDAPRVAYMAQHLQNAANRGLLGDSEKVWDFLESSAGRVALNTGAMGRDARIMTLPAMNSTHRSWARGKAWWTQKIDLGRPLPDHMTEDIATDVEIHELLQAGTITVGEANQMFARFNDVRDSMGVLRPSWFGLKPAINRFTKHVTRDPHIDVTVASANAPVGLAQGVRGISEFIRYTEYGDLVHMSRGVKDEFINRFMKGTEGERIAIIRGFSTELLARSGLLDGSERATELLRSYGLMLDQHFVQSTDLDNVLDMTVDAVTRHSALWDKSQVATMVQIPRYEILARAVRKKHAWDTFGDAVGQADRIMSKYWKSAVLMRLGFIARAAGEETAAFMLRLGFLPYATAQFGRRWASGVVLNPVTNEWTKVDQLSPGFRRIVATGQSMRKWTATREQDLASIALVKMSPAEKMRLQTLAQYLRRGKPDEGTLIEVAQEMNAIRQPYIDAYLKDMTPVSRAVMHLGEFAVTKGMSWSPEFYKAMRTLHLPSRRNVAQAVFGATYDEDTYGLPKLRPGQIGFSARFTPLEVKDLNTVDVNDLMMAQYYAMHVPGVARAEMNAMSGLWADVGVEHGDNLRDISRSHLSAEQTFAEELNWRGKTRIVKTRTVGRRWEEVDQADAAAREAFGNMVMFPLESESLRASRGVEVMASYVGPTVQEDLVRVLGDEWQPRVERARADIARLKELAQHGAQAERQHAQETLARLRLELSTNEPLTGQFAAFNDLNRRARWLLNPAAADEPLRLDLDDMMEEVERRLWLTMQRPDHQESMQTLVRMAHDAGKPIVRPLRAGFRRYYGISLRTDLRQHLEALSADQNLMALISSDLYDDLLTAGYSEVNVNQIMAQLDPLFTDRSFVDEMDSFIPDTGSHKYVPAVPVMFTDPKLAQALSDTLHDAIGRVLTPLDPMMRPFMEPGAKYAEVGLVDIPTSLSHQPRILTSIDADVRYGLRQENGSVVRFQDSGVLVPFQRLDPSMRVRFVKLNDGRVIDERALTEDDLAVGIDGSYEEWASGESEWAARRNLLASRVGQLEDYFITDRGDALTEILGPASNNLFEPTYHTAGIAAEDLPLKMFAPEHVDVTSTRYDRIVQGFFQGIVDPAMRGIIRTTHWMHNFAASLPFANEHYAETVKGRLNDQALKMFDLLGVTDDKLNALLQSIHFQFGDTLDEESDMARLVNALADPNVHGSEGFELLYRALGTNRDELGEIHARLLQAMHNDYLYRMGTEPPPRVLAQMDREAAAVTDLTLEPSITNEAILAQVEEFMRPTPEQLANNQTWENRVRELYYVYQAGPTMGDIPEQIGWYLSVMHNQNDLGWLDELTDADRTTWDGVMAMMTDFMNDADRFRGITNVDELDEIDARRVRAMQDFFRIFGDEIAPRYYETAGFDPFVDNAQLHALLDGVNFSDNQTVDEWLEDLQDAMRDRATLEDALRRGDLLPDPVLTAQYVDFMENVTDGQGITQFDLELLNQYRTDPSAPVPSWFDNWVTGLGIDPTDPEEFDDALDVLTDYFVNGVDGFMSFAPRETRLAEIDQDIERIMGHLQFPETPDELIANDAEFRARIDSLRHRWAEGLTDDEIAAMRDAGMDDLIDFLDPMTGERRTLFFDEVDDELPLEPPPDGVFDEEPIDNWEQANEAQYERNYDTYDRSWDEPAAQFVPEDAPPPSEITDEFAAQYALSRMPLDELEPTDWENLTGSLFIDGELNVDVVQARLDFLDEMQVDLNLWFDSIDEASDTDELSYVFNTLERLRGVQERLRGLLDNPTNVVDDQDLGMFRTIDRIIQRGTQPRLPARAIDVPQGRPVTPPTDRRRFVRPPMSTRADTVTMTVEDRFWPLLQKWSQNRYFRMQEAVEMAAVRATDMTVEFIDDQRFRSQFQQTVRNLMPFWFAQEQFIKRQVRMVVDSPEAIRRASLVMQAGRDSGLIDRDSDGNEIFVYPGTAYINREIARFSSLLTGLDGMEVYSQPMTTNVEYILPGYSGEWLEKPWGPLIGASTALLSEMFPELEPIDREGWFAPNEVAQGRQPWEHFYPPSVANVIDAIGLPFFDHGRMQSAENQAVQMAIAADLDPGPDATGQELDEFRDRIRNFARIIMVMNATGYILGPLPSGNRIRLGDVEMNHTMEELMFNSGLPRAEGLAEFLRRYPNATPFTVFGSESTTGAPLDLNHESYQWLSANKGFVQNYPTAGAWFGPIRQGVSDEDETSRRAQHEAYLQGLRARRSTKEFLEEVYVAEAARIYYPTVNEFEKTIWLGERQNQDMTMVEDEFSMWKEMFLNTHPTFRDRETNRQRRLDIKHERDEILAMPLEDLPTGSQVPIVRELMRAHQTFNRAMDSVEGSSAADTKLRNDLRIEFLLFATQYVDRHPETEAYFTSQIRWDDQIVQAGPGLIFEIEAMLGRDL